MENDIIYIYDENVYGEIISYGVHASLVKYFVLGIQYEVVLENIEFEVIQNKGDE